MLSQIYLYQRIFDRFLSCLTSKQTGDKVRVIKDIYKKFFVICLYFKS